MGRKFKCSTGEKEVGQAWMKKSLFVDNVDFALVDIISIGMITASV